MSEVVRTKQNNWVQVSGVLEDDLKYHHKVMVDREREELFYSTRVLVKRTSGTIDYVPIIISEYRIPRALKHGAKGVLAKVIGEVRSYNRIDLDGNRHLDIFIFVNAILPKQRDEQDENELHLEGQLCRDPIYRRTIVSQREISDLMIAVKRNFGHTDYIPCICWGRFAQYVREMQYGNHIIISGRFQSREYFKKESSDSNEGEFKVAYEISAIDVR